MAKILKHTALADEMGRFLICEGNGETVLSRKGLECFSLPFILLQCVIQYIEIAEENYGWYLIVIDDLSEVSNVIREHCYWAKDLSQSCEYEFNNKKSHKTDSEYMFNERIIKQQNVSAMITSKIKMVVISSVSQLAKGLLKLEHLFVRRKYSKSATTRNIHKRASNLSRIGTV